MPELSSTQSPTPTKQNTAQRKFKLLHFVGLVGSGVDVSKLLHFVGLVGSGVDVSKLLLLLVWWEAAWMLAEACLWRVPNSVK